MRVSTGEHQLGRAEAHVEVVESGDVVERSHRVESEGKRASIKCVIAGGVGLPESR